MQEKVRMMEHADEDDDEEDSDEPTREPSAGTP